MNSFALNLDSFIPKKATPTRAAKKLRHCAPELVTEAWSHFWSDAFRTRCMQQMKFPWETWKDTLPSHLAPHAKQLAAAFLYLFSRWSNYNKSEGRQVPLFSLMLGIQPGDYEGQRALLKEMRDAPRLETKSCSFLWKDRPSAPASLAEYGMHGAAVWRNCLVLAEAASLARITEWRNNQQ